MLRGNSLPSRTFSRENMVPIASQNRGTSGPWHSASVTVTTVTGRSRIGPLRSTVSLRTVHLSKHGQVKVVVLHIPDGRTCCHPPHVSTREKGAQTDGKLSGMAVTVNTVPLGVGQKGDTWVPRLLRTLRLSQKVISEGGLRPQAGHPPCGRPHSYETRRPSFPTALSRFRSDRLGRIHPPCR